MPDPRIKTATITSARSKDTERTRTLALDLQALDYNVVWDDRQDAHDVLVNVDGVDMLYEQARKFVTAELSKLAVQFLRLENGEGLALPAYETPGAAGMDLRAAIPEGEVITLYTTSRQAIPCGFSVALPEGFEAQIRPRSGLAVKHGVTVLNSPGTIDSDYRGQVCAILINMGREPFEIRRGDRIAQMVIAPVTQARFVEVDSLDTTKRGDGAFGSTGRK